MFLTFGHFPKKVSPKIKNFCTIEAPHLGDQLEKKSCDGTLFFFMVKLNFEKKVGHPVFENFYFSSDFCVWGV